LSDAVAFRQSWLPIDIDSANRYAAGRQLMGHRMHRSAGGALLRGKLDQDGIASMQGSLPE
jgi:hypothetical protein